MTSKGALGSGIIALTVVLGFLYAHHQYAKAKAEAKNTSLCQNSDGNRVKIPAGFFRDNSGACVKQKTVEEQAAEKAKAAQEYAAAHPPEDPEYPRNGAGYATNKVTAIKAWLDPRKTFVRPSQPARYEVEGHPTMYVDDFLDRRNDKKWWTMPKGRYLIFPLGEEEIYVRWWQ